LAVWYLGNIYYNIYNKKACIALGKNAAGASNAHWALSAVQVSRGEKGRLEGEGETRRGDREMRRGEKDRDEKGRGRLEGEIKRRNGEE
jgi:hypothetical protein